MKLNALEMCLVNNPLRGRIQEAFELRALKAMLPADRFDAVLEIGCGNGAGTRLISKHFAPRTLAAIDLDVRMIRLAKDRHRGGSARFQVMDASRLGFADRSFDAVFDFGAIHHVPNWQRCIAELQRVLKPGGKLVLEEFSIDTFSGFPGALWRRLLRHPYDRMFSTRQFVREIGAAGFRIDRFRQINTLGISRHFYLTATAA